MPPIKRHLPPRSFSLPKVPVDPALADGQAVDSLNTEPSHSADLPSGASIELAKPGTSKSLSATSQVPSLPTDSAKILGHTSEFGSKAANLLFIQHLIDNGSLPLPNIAVPHTLPLSHAYIMDHMQRSSVLVQLLDDTVLALRQSAQDGTLNPQTTSLLAILRLEITQHFKEKPVPLSKEFLASVAVKQRTLMVRSTGDEDNQFSNAGGNESIVNVALNHQKISEAIGAVVVSYFGEKSLEQRLAAKDDIGRMPLVPVLVQEMIGESADSGVPVSGVLYTDEVSGPTENVVEIYGTWGHNAAVVAGLVPCDAAFVDSRGNVSQIVRDKDARLQPTSTSGLQRVENSNDMRTQACMSPELISRLTQVADGLRKAYGTTRDIEWTYDPKSDCLYLLQARFLEIGDTHPTYLSLEAIKDTEQLRVSVIGSGTGAVQHITDKSSVIVAGNLRIALQRFFAAKKKGIAIAAIIVRDTPTAGSHEANVLRSNRVPVLVCEHTAQVQQWLSTSHCDFAIDMQRSILVRGMRGPLTDSIVQGRYQHPLPGNLAFSSKLQAHKHHAVKRLARNLLATHFSPNNYLDILYQQVREVLVANRDYASIRACLDALAKSGDKEVVRTILTVLMYHAQRLSSHIAQQAPLQREAWGLFTTVCERSQQVLDALTHDDDSSQRLYAVGWLRTVFLDQPDADTRSAVTYVTLLSRAKHVAGLRAESAAASFPSETEEALDLVGQLALTPATREAWKKFTQALSGAEVKRLTNLFLAAQRRRVTSVLLNQFFAKMDTSNPRQCLAALEQTWSIAELATRNFAFWRQTINHWQGRIEDWAQPENFPELYKQFWVEIIQPLGAPLPVESEKSLPAQKLAAILQIATVHEAVQLLDDTIKSVTGSPIWREEAHLLDLARAMTKLVTDFQDITEKWMTRLPWDCVHGYEKVQWDKLLERTAAAMHYDINELRQGKSLSEKKLAALVEATDGFDVRQVSMSGTSCERTVWPMSLEDMHTAAHQNALHLLIKIAALGAPIHKQDLPPIVLQAVEAIEGPIASGIVFYNVSFKRTHLHIENFSVRCTLVASLRGHALQVQFEYDLRYPNQLRVNVGMYAQEEDGRLERLLAWQTCTGLLLGGFKPADLPRFNNSTTSCCWHIEPSHNKAETPWWTIMRQGIEEQIASSFNQSEDAHPALCALELESPAIAAQLMRIDRHEWSKYPGFLASRATEQWLKFHGQDTTEWQAAYNELHGSAPTQEIQIAHRVASDIYKGLANYQKTFVLAPEKAIDELVDWGLRDFYDGARSVKILRQLLKCVPDFGSVVIDRLFSDRSWVRRSKWVKELGELVHDIDPNKADLFVRTFATDLQSLADLCSFAPQTVRDILATQKFKDSGSKDAEAIRRLHQALPDFDFAPMIAARIEYALRWMEIDVALDAVFLAREVAPGCDLNFIVPLITFSHWVEYEVQTARMLLNADSAYWPALLIVLCSKTRRWETNAQSNVPGRFEAVFSEVKAEAHKAIESGLFNPSSVPMQSLRTIMASYSMPATLPLRGALDFEVLCALLILLPDQVSDQAIRAIWQAGTAQQKSLIFQLGAAPPYDLVDNCPASVVNSQVYQSAQDLAREIIAAAARTITPALSKKAMDELMPMLVPAALVALLRECACSEETLTAAFGSAASPRRRTKIEAVGTQLIRMLELRPSHSRASKLLWKRQSLNVTSELLQVLARGAFLKMA